MIQCPTAALSTSSATCHCCPDEAWPIFQPAHSATSAPLIEIFMWLNSDLRCESVVAVQMCSPIKSSLQKLFCPTVLKQSYLIKGALLTPPKLAVIFHLYAHEGKWSDTVIHLRQKLQLGQREITSLPILSFVLLALDTKSLKTQFGF